MVKVKKNICISSVIIVTIVILIIISYWSELFQKGNPVPYLKAIVQLDNNQTYIKLKENQKDIFITKRNNYKDFLEYLENNYDVSIYEQMGNGYIFKSDDKVEVLVTSEIYLRYYKVWTLSID